MDFREFAVSEVERLRALHRGAGITADRAIYRQFEARCADAFNTARARPGLHVPSLDLEFRAVRSRASRSESLEASIETFLRAERRFLDISTGAAPAPVAIQEAAGVTRIIQALPRGDAPAPVPARLSSWREPRVPAQPTPGEQWHKQRANRNAAARSA